MLGFTSNRYSKHKTIFLIILAASVVFWYLNGPAMLSRMMLKMRYHMYQYQKPSAALVQHYQDVEQEELALKLEAEMMLYHAKISAIKKLQGQNQALLDLMKQSDQQINSLGVARRFYHSSHAANHTYMIQLTRKANVGQAVMSEHGIAGQIVAVDEHFAKVNDLNHPDTMIPVENASGSVHAIAKGIGNTKDLMALEVISGDRSTLAMHEAFYTSSGNHHYRGQQLVGQLDDSGHMIHISTYNDQQHWVLYESVK